MFMLQKFFINITTFYFISETASICKKQTSNKILFNKVLEKIRHQIFTQFKNSKSNTNWLSKLSNNTDLISWIATKPSLKIFCDINDGLLTCLRQSFELFTSFTFILFLKFSIVFAIHQLKQSFFKLAPRIFSFFSVKVNKFFYPISLSEH